VNICSKISIDRSLVVSSEKHCYKNVHFQVLEAESLKNEPFCKKNVVVSNHWDLLELATS